MPARILILDGVAASRTVLKAKMQAAQYAVDACADRRTAEKAIAQARPDLILINFGDPGGRLHGFCKSLRNTPDTASIAIIATGSADTIKARFAALDAGADDVMPEPINDPLLLARIRSLLRARSASEELMLRDSMVRALGFEDRRSPFENATKVGFIKEPSMTLPVCFDGSLPASMKIVSIKEALCGAGPSSALDVVIIDARNILQSDRALLGLVSDLRAREATRYTTQLVLTPPHSPEIAALFLDLGADDIVPEGCSRAEVSLRIKALIRRKKQQDALRIMLHDGLHAALTDPLPGFTTGGIAILIWPKLQSKPAYQGGPLRC